MTESVPMKSLPAQVLACAVPSAAEKVRAAINMNTHSQPQTMLAQSADSYAVAEPEVTDP